MMERADAAHASTAGQTSSARSPMSRRDHLALWLAALSLALSIMTLLTIWFGGSSLVPRRDESSDWRVASPDELASNGWQNGGASSAAGYYIDNDRVYLRGGLSPIHENIGLSSTLFVLPKGFRPLRGVVFLVPADRAYGRLRIDPGGSVVADLSVVPKLLSLDGVSFRLD